jgi:HPt (histidine-containing phosphotransfer) domain-containing protein
VRVHGLKSTARTIGAMQLSTKAKEMEDVGHVLTDTPEDADSLAYVDANLQALLDLYDKTVAAIPQLKL